MTRFFREELPAAMHPQAVGARLRLLREAAGLTAAELCRTLGINRGTYSNFEHGRRSAPEHIKVRLADYYGTTLDHLILGRIPEDDLEALLDRLRARRGFAAPEGKSRPPRPSRAGSDQSVEAIRRSSVSRR